MLAKVAADELGRYGTTVNAIAPAARTRLTDWLPDGPPSPADDPWAPEHVAPVVAWLLGPGARDITARVIEVGNGQVSVPDGCRPGTAHPLPPNISTAEAETLLSRVFAAAAAPRTLLGTDVG
jgi:hypothetical protein